MGNYVPLPLRPLASPKIDLQAMLINLDEKEG